MRVSLFLIKRFLDFFGAAVFCLAIISLIYRPSKYFPDNYKAITRSLQQQKQQQVILFDIKDDGFNFASNDFSTEKFLSYEPPLGSWSKQLLAFQNAVIIATLLKRTLIVQPLISEEEGKRLKTLVRAKHQSESEAYKLIDFKYMVPMSAVINLRVLRQLLNVRAIHSTYIEFHQKYSNLTWYNVCHKDNRGFWVDFIPSPDNDLAWRVLEAQEFVPLKPYFFGIEPVCAQEMEMFDQVQTNAPVIRGILTELSRVNEEVIYFRGGSLAARELRFLSKARTKLVQTWIAKYIQFSPYVKSKIHKIVESMETPYNAVKLTSNRNLEIMNNTIRFRLNEMEKKNFRNITSRLYVINEFNETNGLQILKQKGYKLYSIMDLVPYGISGYIKRDVQKLLGELLCKYAWFYEGPLDSYLIQRARVHQARLIDGLLTNLVTVKWALHTINRNHRLWFPRKTGENVIPSSIANFKRGPLLNVWCKLCKTMKRQIKAKACRTVLTDCIKLKL